MLVEENCIRKRSFQMNVIKIEKEFHSKKWEESLIWEFIFKNEIKIYNKVYFFYIERNLL